MAKVKQVKNGRYVESPDGPLVVLLGRQQIGCNYELSGLSHRRILREFPQTRVVPAVYVTHPAPGEFEAVHGPLWDQIVTLITGLRPAQISKLGGVVLYDPRAKEEWIPQLKAG